MQHRFLFLSLICALLAPACLADDQTISDNVLASNESQSDAGATSNSTLDTATEADSNEAEDVAPDGAADTASEMLDTATSEDTAQPPMDTSEPPDTNPPDLPPEDMGPPPEPVTCVLPASFAGDYQEVNTWMANTERVSFVVPGLPNPEQLTAVQLLYTGYDTDHPGAEGWIKLNSSPRFELPADEALDNESRAFSVDITGQTVAGDNTVQFIAFDTPEGAYYQISQVRIEATGPGLECPDPIEEPGATGNGTTRTMNYREATYDRRRNWVLDCRDYAYSARGDEHEDCDDAYNPDGSTGGRAVFVFDNVIADRYEVRVEGRNTINRNPARALWIVNGIERRISQRDDRGYVYDTHGVYNLNGRVEVVLDSTREVGSDAVRNVQIRPVQ